MHWLVSLLLILITVEGFAQKAAMEEEPKVEIALNKNKRVKVTGYGFLQINPTGVDDEGTAFLDLGGGVLFDGRYFVGMRISNMAGTITREVAGIPDLTLGASYAGFQFNYFHKPHKLVHPMVGASVAWGTVGWQQNLQLFNNEIFVQDVFLYTVDGGVELNLAEYIRLTVTGGYRWMENLDIQGLNDDAFNNFFIGLGIKMGKF
ncbi:MAG: hypothetical protein ACFB0B_19185 [Thermonemataceae bacterium]